MSRYVFDNIDEARRLAGVVTEATGKPDSFKILVYRHEDGTWSWTLEGSYTDEKGAIKKLKTSGEAKNRKGALADIRSYMDRMRPETASSGRKASSEELDLDTFQTELDEALDTEDLSDRIRALGEKMKIAFKMIKAKMPKPEGEG